METARWIDMIDPVYTLVRISGLDPESVNITSIFVGDQIDHACDGVRAVHQRHVSKKYEF